MQYTTLKRLLGVVIAATCAGGYWASLSSNAHGSAENAVAGQYQDENTSPAEQDNALPSAAFSQKNRPILSTTPHTAAVDGIRASNNNAATTSADKNTDKNTAVENDTTNENHDTNEAQAEAESETVNDHTESSLDTVSATTDRLTASSQSSGNKPLYGYPLGNTQSQVWEEFVDHQTEGMNYPPQINHAVREQLQKIASNWAFTQEMPVRYTLPIENLFIDPEGDPISIRAYISIPGVQISPSNTTLRVQGMPQTFVNIPTLVIEAQDDQHAHQQWATAHFSLRPMVPPAEQVPHPLEGDTLFRLDTTQLLGGTNYNYEVVYCQAWRFKNGLAFYAASDNKTHCPLDSQLQEIGEYSIDDNNDLIVTSTTSAMHGKQRWKVKWMYDSWYRQGVKNLFTTVYTDKHVESYTLQRSRSAMEARLNVETGRVPFEMEMFDYLVPLKNGQFLQSIAGNYVYLYGPHDTYQGLDSDWNLHSPLRDLACDEVLPFWESSVLAGEGETGDIIANSADPWSSAPIHCGVHYREDWQRRYVYFGLQYYRYDYFVPGNIYSFVIRPKPEYAHLVEAFKINLRYHNPDYMEP